MHRILHLPSGINSATLDSLSEDKLSTHSTDRPRSNKWRHRWLPMKPAPPVTRTLLIDFCVYSSTSALYILSPTYNTSVKSPTRLSGTVTVPSSLIIDVYTTVSLDTISIVSPARYSVKVKTWSVCKAVIGIAGVRGLPPYPLPGLIAFNVISTFDTDSASTLFDRQNAKSNNRYAILLISIDIDCLLQN